MQSEGIKKSYRLLENLPEKATCDDLMYRIYVHQAIEADINLDLAFEIYYDLKSAPHAASL